MADPSLQELIELGAGHTNDDIAAAARGLSLYALKQLHYNLQHGTPAFKQRILSIYIPQLIKAATGEDEDDANAELRAQVERMNGSVLSALGITVPEELGDVEIDEDGDDG